MISYQLVDESYIWPPLKDKGALAIYETITRLSVPGDLFWDQWGRLEQYVLIFPSDKISQAFEAMSAEGFSKIIAKEKVPLSFQELPNPAIGERSRAFCSYGVIVKMRCQLPYGSLPIYHD